MNNTPRTDDAQFGTGRVSVNFARQLETELNEAREQLKKTRKYLKDANRGAEINAHALRINADKLAAVTEQRDRLAEALERIKDYQGRFGEDDPTSIATEALQSLNQDHTGDANDMIAAVKGGSDES